ncbi:cytochrome b [Stutzerimonas urumqiensis]|uniref:cytochrome b n=1 Tax=Stutzerimonas urumqiensis TaxID=638269 RepID=UPI000EAB86EC|nr:cytochrome b [Stutzerimonas urumqiensis]
MRLRNSPNGYGLITIGMHWIVAVAVFGLFGLGLWMRGLDYYSPWYQTAPDIHKSVGLLLLGLMLLRVLWRLYSPAPHVLPTHGRATRLATRFGHAALYLALFGVMIAGYLISTAEGRPIPVFGWFEVPALITSIPRQEDIAGLLHEYLAWALVILSGLHALAALKHHFIDRDATLVRMLGRERN